MMILIDLLFGTRSRPFGVEGTKPMKRLLFPVTKCLLTWAVVGSFGGITSFASDDVKTTVKVRKKTASVTRAQNAEKEVPNKTAALTDEEILDRDLSPASPGPKSAGTTATGAIAKKAVKTVSNSKPIVTDEEIFDYDFLPASNQVGGGGCAPNSLPAVPNCTDVYGNPLMLPGSNSLTSPTPDSSPASPTPIPPDMGTNQNPLTNQNPQSNMPPQNNYAGGAQDIATNTTTSFAAPFIGDFFGGSLAGTASGSPVVGEVVNIPNTNSYYALNTYGSVPNHFQTVGSPFTSTAMPGTAGTFSMPGHGSGLTLAPIGPQTVLFNPPATAPGGYPNPQNLLVYDVQSHLNTGGIDPALATGRTKLAEGASPIPRDRVFFNYSMFNDVQLQTQGVAVNRYTPGFEKTFFNGNASIEVRMPFASTLSSNIDSTTGFVNPTDMQFGNLTIYNKALLYQNRTFAYSTGFGITVPTANNVNVYNGSTQLLHIQNDSVHLMPFLGGVYTPNDRFYTQSIVQLDFDANGNAVDSYLNSNGALVSSSQKVGTFRDATYLYASVGTGYWMYRSNTPGRFGITGFSPTAELHYNRSLTDGNIVTQNVQQTTSTAMTTNLITPVYGQAFTNIEVLNAVVGTNMLFGRNRILTMGYTAPLGMGVDKQFAGEFRVMFNWYFGGGYNSNTTTRTGGVQF
jgi:hypothetical protein